jgi:cell division protein FtsN
LNRPANTTRNKTPRSALPAARKRAPRGSGRGGTLLGVFVGLVLGLSLAAGVAYYVTKANSPYSAQTAKDAREPGRDPLRDVGKSGKPDAAAPDKPRFDFYKILPGGEEPKVQVERKVAPDRVVVDQAKDKDKDKDKDKEKDKAAERAPAKVAMAEPAAKAVKAGERFWLQAGSFAMESDAENLKAQLALAGWEAAVQPGTLPDKGVRYRVRLGPYDNTDELNRIKSDLGRKGFDVAVIKF